MIEPAKSTDASAIEQLARNAGVFTEDEVRVVGEMLTTFLHPKPGDDYSFVVYRDGNLNTIGGFACFGPVPFTDRVWDLYWICVDHTAQRTGIGTQLITHVENELRTRGARAVYLETSDSPNYCAARAFYQRHSYECIAHIDEFYAPGEGKVMYRKKLQQ